MSTKTMKSVRTGDTMYFVETGAKVKLVKCDRTKNQFVISPAQNGRSVVSGEELMRPGEWFAIQDENTLSSTAKGLKTKHQRHVENMERLRARRGDAPEYDMVKPVPIGFHLKGTSTLYNEKGEVVQQWVKTNIDKDHQLEALLAAFEEISDKIPREPVIKRTSGKLSHDTMCVYPMGDPHIGMHAWAEETLDKNFDIKIAEAQIMDVVDRLVDLAPPTHTGLIINLGDFFHSDSQDNRTRRSGANLDVDTRWAKILGVGMRIMCRVIERALEKHEQIIVRNEIGNHDDHTAIMLSIGLEHHYMNNPRVKIDTSPAKFWYLEFGKNLFGTTHGDTVKLDKLPGIMAADMAEAWGRTKHRYWYTGHVHHDKTKEYDGAVVVETFRTLAPRDAWHAGQGYRSGQDMKLDVVHREYGRITRHVVGIDQILGHEEK